MWCSNCPNFDTCEDRPSWAVDATLTEPMSMREFSRLIRRSPSHISRVMNGKRASATISRLMKTLGVEVA